MHRRVNVELLCGVTFWLMVAAALTARWLM